MPVEEAPGVFARPSRRKMQKDEISMRFSDKMALVAGGTGGLGHAVSLAFLALGATVVVTYREQKEFDALQSEAGANSSLIEGHRIDVTDEAAVRQLVDGVIAKHGQLDALVNTVGGYTGGVNLWETDAKVFDRMLALNLRSGYALARAAIPVMLKQKRGAIVNVAAKAALDHGAGASAYAASKAGALALMDSLAAEVKGSGIRVNTILPSVIDTAANREAMPNADFAKWPKPHDIARVILFLCSDDSKVIRGAAIPVYGDS
jgi:NAD(P)-dependent dehydrogenase (short-subunit alcohol dehydrogenase family)